MFTSVPPLLKRLGYGVLLGTVLAAQPLTVVVSAQPARSAAPQATEHGVSVNAANSTDLPSELEDLPVITPQGVLVGHVSDMRMDDSSESYRVQAVEVTADEVDPAEPLSWWVDAKRISITPDAVILAPPGPQQAERN